MRGTATKGEKSPFRREFPRPNRHNREQKKLQIKSKFSEFSLQQGFRRETSLSSAGFFQVDSKDQRINTRAERQMVGFSA